MKARLLVLGLLMMRGLLHGQGIEGVQSTGGDKAERRDVFVTRMVEHPRAVLVLCPGQNRNGRALLEQKEWKQFASENNVALAAISFASDDDTLREGGGYFEAGKGSGEQLLASLHKVCGRDLPLLLYGFSGGAHFVNSFVNWKPESVLTFCAYSAAWWEQPALEKKMPPGIVACGADDGVRNAACQSFFAKGRAGGKSWTWLSLGNTGHQPSKPLDGFVRDYFAVLLGRGSDGTVEEWHDVDTKKLLTPVEVKGQPTLACWLPNARLGAAWSALHQP